jgi:hypothetical protein
LADEEIERIYGKRWDIEVFFKMAKQHLKLAKEIQCRDFDALIAHTTMVFMRYMFLAYPIRPFLFCRSWIPDAMPRAFCSKDSSNDGDAGTIPKPLPNRG